MEISDPSSSLLERYIIDTSSLCAEVSYFAIFPYSLDQINTQSVVGINPFIITFRQDSTQIRDIRNRYLQMNLNEKIEKKRLGLKLSDGFPVDKNMTIKQLKKNLSRDNLDGLILYIYLIPVQVNNNSTGDYSNQCGMMDWMSSLAFDMTKEFTFNFHLPSSNYVVTIVINPKKKVTELIDLFIFHLSKNYKIKFKNQSVQREIGKQHIKEYILANKTKLTKLDKFDQILIRKCPQLQDQDDIKVEMLDDDFQLIKVISLDIPITLIKEGENPTQKTKVLINNFSNVADLTVTNLYKNFFLSSEQRQSFDVVTRNNKICLKIIDYLLYPNDTLLKYFSSFQKLKKLGNLKLVAYFVSQKMVFYRKIRTLTQKYTFQLGHIRPKQIKENKITGEQCQQRSKEIAQTRVSKLQTLTHQRHFVSPQQILPIVLYSSELLVDTGNPKDDQKIYAYINNTLRSMSIKTVLSEVKESWCYKYIGTLERHLSKIKGKKIDSLYRGTNYKIQGKIGDRVTFRSLLSTSAGKDFPIKRAIANQIQDIKEFNSRAKSREQQKHLPLPLVLFQISAQSGKSIKYFSVFQNEEQFLFEPYSEFYIKNIRQQKIQHEGTFYPFTVYQLQQIPTPQHMPPTINNYIIWVDENSSEINTIYNEYIKRFYYPTTLFQLKSTKQLQSWLQEMNMIVNDPSKKIVMITNMVRMEENGSNFYAGVEAINIVNDFFSAKAVENPERKDAKIPIAIYTRDAVRAYSNLRERAKSNCDNVQVINDVSLLMQFLSSNLGVKCKGDEIDDILINFDKHSKATCCEVM